MITGKVDFMELNDGFEIKTVSKGKTPYGILYTKNKPIATMAREIFFQSYDDGLNEPIVKMSDKKRKIIDLYFIEGLKMADIARKENMPIGTVKASIKQIKEKAVKLLNGKVKSTERKRYNEKKQLNDKIEKMIKAKNKIKKIKMIKGKGIDIDNYIKTM